MLTFGWFLLSEIFNLQYSVWNFLFPNILTIGVLILYIIDILFGYEPETTKQNFKSLIIVSILIIMLTIIQISQFEFLWKNVKPKPWQITTSVITVLISNIEVITNRILQIKYLKEL